ncbi:damage response protein 1 [[Candida] railenensis]|uniref:Damage response protein 1 n=1 Tax=[Candida] railenensis TaxID=45579 RepID=A0A9P0QL31_9ASCO|nr:damage response protein 1 [[Candida] railenensis]
MITITGIIVLALIAYFAKEFITGGMSISNPLENSTTDSAPIVEGRFTPLSLAKFNGTDDPKILIAVKGKVYDVSNGASFYGPGGPYENFAGRDASRGLAKNSFELDCLTPTDQPIDQLKNLTADEIESLDGWEQHFEGKYPLVGTLHENGDSI